MFFPLFGFSDRVGFDPLSRNLTIRSRATHEPVAHAAVKQQRRRKTLQPIDSSMKKAPDIRRFLLHNNGLNSVVAGREGRQTKFGNRLIKA